MHAMRLDETTRARLRSEYWRLKDVELVSRTSEQFRAIVDVRDRIAEACDAWSATSNATRKTVGWIAQTSGAGSPDADFLDMEPYEAAAARIGEALRDIDAMFQIAAMAVVDDNGQPRRIALRWLLIELEGLWESGAAQRASEGLVLDFEQFARYEVEAVDPHVGHDETMSFYAELCRQRRDAPRGRLAAMASMH
jgi:hypothetical protein